MMVALLHLIAIAVQSGAYNWSSTVGALPPLMFAECLATSLTMLWIYRK